MRGENYYNNPIRIYYRLAEWKYTGEPNRVIINRLSSKLCPKMKVHCKTYVDISNVPIGVLKSCGNIKPYVELEEKIIPNISIIERKERAMCIQRFQPGIYIIVGHMKKKN